MESESESDSFVCETAGCFCVYNSKSSLGHVQQSLESSLLCDLQRENRRDFHGLPVVVVLGHNPDADERTLALLREGGQLLADRYVFGLLVIIVGRRRRRRRRRRFCIDLGPLCGSLCPFKCIDLAFDKDSTQLK